MRKLNIHLENDRKAFEPGETIRVMLEWSLPEEPKKLELRVVWSTVGKGTADVGVEHTTVIDSPRQEDSREMELTLPMAPYSFSGTLISLVWALELVVLPSLESRRVEITIAPEASEIILERVT
jgi:hypothetical protein